MEKGPFDAHKLFLICKNKNYTKIRIFKNILVLELEFKILQNVCR